MYSSRDGLNLLHEAIPLELVKAYGAADDDIVTNKNTRYSGDQRGLRSSILRTIGTAAEAKLRFLSRSQLATDAGLLAQASSRRSVWDAGRHDGPWDGIQSIRMTQPC